MDACQKMTVGVRLDRVLQPSPKPCCCRRTANW